MTMFNGRPFRGHDYDNRDQSAVIEYLEARVEALKQRIGQLEAQHCPDCDCYSFEKNVYVAEEARNENDID